jgi:hypothetical protein
MKWARSGADNKEVMYNNNNNNNNNKDEDHPGQDRAGQEEEGTLQRSTREWKLE